MKDEPQFISQEVGQASRAIGGESRPAIMIVVIGQLAHRGTVVTHDIDVFLHAPPAELNVTHRPSGETAGWTAHAEPGVICSNLSLGASRLRIVQQLVTESALMGLMAGGVALLFTWMLLKAAVVAMANVIPGEYGGLVFNVTPDLAIFTYVSVISLIAGIISGLAPAMESSRAALKPTSSGATATGRTRRLQDGLIAAQVTLSLALVVAATMAIRSSIRAVAIDTGYETRVLALDIQFPDSLKYTAGRKQVFVEELRARLEKLPGVASVTNAPIPADTGLRTAAATFERSDPSKLSRQAIVHYAYVQPNYFQTLGIPLILGSGFTSRVERTVIVSESAAHELFEGGNPIGRTLRLGSIDGIPRRSNELVANGLSYQVVGVARDTRAADFDSSVSKRLYLPLQADRAASYPLLVRTHDTFPSETIRLLDPLLASLDPNVVASCTTLDGLLRQTAPFVVAVLASLVASVLGLFGLVLAIMGIYGTVSYIVVLRTREVGIRMAIGAQARDVIWAILRESARPLLAGLAAGTLLAATLAHFARGLLFGLDGVDLELQALVALTFLVIGLLASYPPARRATRVDPLIALRHQ